MTQLSTTELKAKQFFRPSNKVIQEFQNDGVSLELTIAKKKLDSRIVSFHENHFIRNT